MNRITNDFLLPRSAKLFRLRRRHFSTDENLAMQSRFTVFVRERDHVGRPNVVQELFVEPCHFPGIDELKTKFVIRGFKMVIEHITNNAPEQMKIDGTDALPVPQAERHLL